MGGCNAELGTFSAAGVTVRSTISAEGGCTSLRRLSRPHGTYHARRHILRLAHPGWVTVTLESDVTYPGGPDTYLIILAGDAADGSGARITANDDHRSDYDTHWRNSRITDKLLEAGTYTIEATTYYRHNPDRPARTTGAYTLHVTVDHTPRAAGQPTELSVENGRSIVESWTVEPGTATVQISTPLPDGITANVTRYAGTATLVATPSRTGEYDIDITYTNGPGTHTATTTITAQCPTNHTETSTGTCIPNTATLPTGCAPTALHGGSYWGRNELLRSYNDYSNGAPVECVSLSHSGGSIYYEFSVPTRLAVALGVSDEYGHASSLTQSGGRPSITLWRRNGFSGAVVLAATEQASPSGTPELSVTVDAGTYVIEIAPSKEVLQPTWSMRIKTTLPTGQRQYDDVRRFGATGDVPNQLTLAQFLDARANDHADYPYLTWTSDNCTSSPDKIHYNITGVAVLTSGSSTRTVPVFKACWRHDFNWRNLTRVQHHVDPSVSSWSVATKEEADSRLGTDIRQLCDETFAESSWILARNSCYLDAAVYKLAVGTIVRFEQVGINRDIGPPETDE